MLDDTRHAMRLRTLSVLTVLLLLPAVSAAAPGSTGDPASALAQRTLDAMGGNKSFAGLRTLAFDFVVERDGKEAARWHHLWDRWDGRYRVEGVNREGKHFLALFNVQHRGEGQVWLDGVALSGEDLAKALDRAYARFINDTYWLLMPAKLLDPGVHLSLEDPEEKDGKTYDVLRVTFDDGVGLTPHDTYWAYIAKDTGLMERWEMVLTGQKPEERSAYTWTDWESVDGVKLAMKKAAVGAAAVIRFDHVSGSPDESKGFVAEAK
jgi:hypothetical protein